jgi:hypothetical protein
LRGSG